VLVRSVPAGEIEEALDLLRSSLYGEAPLPKPFCTRMREEVEAGRMEVIAAYDGGGIPLGAATVHYRPSISAGTLFASIEDLYVVPGSRRQGTGRALLAEIGERCAHRGISYVEVQVAEEAEEFYRACGFGPEEVRVLSRTVPLLQNSSTS
jgi:GNAT superfamily N-acetyltransferase